MEIFTPLDRIEDWVKNARSAPHASGHIWLDGQEVAQTQTCVHCGHTWVFVKGSGRKRGWCMNCSGMTCGQKKCNRCLPLEKKLDLYERKIIPVLR